jgi:beta-lactamase class A
MDRRTLLAALAAAASPAPVLARPAPAGVAMLAALERRAGGRLGVMVRDSASGRGFGWRADERFAHCSTFKLSLAALVLARIDAGTLRGDEVLYYSVLDVLPASPVTEAAAAQEGLPILTLARAAVMRSDNLAANLLLARVGGPPALTAFWRALGDGVSRLDHKEPLLNRVGMGALHDTTTPAAMARTVAQILTGPVLSGESRAVLWGWMKDTTTGNARLRAGLPAGWQGGDKTGSEYGPEALARVNDLALALAPVGDRRFRAPVAVAAYYVPGGLLDSVRPEDEAVLAAVMRIATDPMAWKARRR